MFCYFFFFQAEDGIRDTSVTGVQTCALPIYLDELAGRRSRTPGAGLVRLLLASRVVHVVRTDEAMEEAALNVYERSEERRVGKECRSRGGREREEKIGRIAVARS